VVRCDDGSSNVGPSDGLSVFLSDESMIILVVFTGSGMLPGPIMASFVRGEGCWCAEVVEIEPVAPSVSGGVPSFDPEWSDRPVCCSRFGAECPIAVCEEDNCVPFRDFVEA
jgi:hypothetical protein